MKHCPRFHPFTCLLYPSEWWMHLLLVLQQCLKIIVDVFVRGYKDQLIAVCTLIPSPQLTKCREMHKAILLLNGKIEIIVVMILKCIVKRRRNLLRTLQTWKMTCLTFLGGNHHSWRIYWNGTSNVLKTRFVPKEICHLPLGYKYDVTFLDMVRRVVTKDLFLLHKPQHSSLILAV